MSKILPKFLSEFGSVASLIGLIVSLHDSSTPFKGWQWLLIFLSAALFILSTILEMQDFFNNRPKTFSKKEAIRDYMYKWIRNGGRTAIFTRDLSWVSDDEMRNMLGNKAASGELMIFLPARIDKVNALEEQGADIIEYSSFNFVPLSRFTITNFGRDDARIAVGKSVSSNKHIIEEYSNGEHPYFQVANDLLNLLDRN